MNFPFKREPENGLLGLDFFESNKLCIDNKLDIITLT
jgi:hypothetical protein